MHDLKVKVTDLDILGPHYFQTLWWIWFMFGVMRYWSKILHSAIPIPLPDFKVKVTDLELLC